MAEDYFILFSFYSKLTFFFPSRFPPAPAAACIQFRRFHHRRNDFSKGIARRFVCVFEGGTGNSWRFWRRWEGRSWLFGSTTLMKLCDFVICLANSASTQVNLRCRSIFHPPLTRDQPQRHCQNCCVLSFMSDDMELLRSKTLPSQCQHFEWKVSIADNRDGQHWNRTRADTPQGQAITFIKAHGAGRATLLLLLCCC